MVTLRIRLILRQFLAAFLSWTLAFAADAPAASDSSIRNRYAYQGNQRVQVWESRTRPLVIDHRRGREIWLDYLLG